MTSDTLRKTFQHRSSVSAKTFSCLFLILLLRLWYLQTIQGQEYFSLSQRNSIRLVVLKSPRGNIMDRNGVPIATNRPSFNATMFRPGKEGNKELREELFKLVRSEKEYSEFPLRRFAPLKKDISLEELFWIEERKPDLTETSIEIQPRRFYPVNSFASHVTGYVSEISRIELQKLSSEGYRQGDEIGKSGIEKQFENWLRGENGGKQVLVDAKGYHIKVLGEKEPVPGKNVWLTIDYRVQKIIEDAIGTKRGSIVVMDPRNGKLLGLASYPSFDPNMFTHRIKYDKWRELTTQEHSVFINRAVQGEYPPGSTFKLVIALAALEEGLIAPKDELYCEGSYTLGKSSFRCWKKGGHGSLNIIDGIVHSCDVFFYQLGRRVGVERIAQYARKLGFNYPSGIDIPGEESGLIPTPRWKKGKFAESWFPGDTVNMSIGQGYVLTTPVQITNAYSTLANGGTLYRPQLLEAIKTEDGKILKKTNPEIIRELEIRPDTKHILQKAFTEVVSRGTGHTAKVDEVEVAGKTGTSQNPHGADHAWFIGYAPAGSPRVCVTVMFENAGHGSSASAPVCGKIIKEILRLQNLG